MHSTYSELDVIGYRQVCFDVRTEFRSKSIPAKELVSVTTLLSKAETKPFVFM